MKKIITLLTLILSVFVFSQKFILTPNNFKTAHDESKEFLVLEFPNISKDELFNKTKQFVNKYYNNPKFVTSESEKDQIVINAFGSKYSMTMFNWYNEYQIELQFKDGKIKFTPKFKFIKNINDGNDIPLNMQSGYLWAVFNKKGNVMRSKAKEISESDVDDFIIKLTESINNSENW